MSSFAILPNEENNDINERNLKKKVAESKILLEKLNNGEKLNNDQLIKIIKYKDFIEKDNIYKIQNKNKELLDRINYIRNENKSSKKKYSNMQKQIKNKIEKITNIEQQLEILNKRHLSLIKNNKELNDMNTNLKNNNNILEMESEQCQLDKSLLEMKNRQLEEKNRKKSEKIERLYDKIEVLRERIDRMVNADNIWIKPTVQLNQIISEIKRLTSCDTVIELCNNVDYINFPRELTASFMRRHGAGYNPSEDFNPTDFQ